MNKHLVRLALSLMLMLLVCGCSPADAPEAPPAPMPGDMSGSRILQVFRIQGQNYYLQTDSILYREDGTAILTLPTTVQVAWSKGLSAFTLMHDGTVLAVFLDGTSRELAGTAGFYPVANAGDLLLMRQENNWQLLDPAAGTAAAFCYDPGEETVCSLGSDTVYFYRFDETSARTSVTAVSCTDGSAREVVNKVLLTRPIAYSAAPRVEKDGSVWLHNYGSMALEEYAADGSGLRASYSLEGAAQGMSQAQLSLSVTSNGPVIALCDRAGVSTVRVCSWQDGWKVLLERKEVFAEYDYSVQIEADDRGFVCSRLPGYEIFSETMD